MKTSYLVKWDQINESPRPVTRARVAELIRASRSRRGRGNTWRTTAGWWIRDAGLTLTRSDALPLSNYTNAHRYTVQAQCSGMGWVDTRHGGDTQAQAEAARLALLADDSAWMPGKRETRITRTRGKT